MSPLKETEQAMSEVNGLPIPTNATKFRARAINRWNEGYQATMAYAIMRGNTEVTPKTMHNGVLVGHWIRNRRAEYQKGRLGEDAIELIEKIPNWLWEPHRTEWFQRFHMLQAAYQTMGNRCLTSHAAVDGITIGAWVRSQRLSRANGILASEFIDQLESLHFWSWGEVKPYKRPSAKDAKRRPTK